MAARHHKAWIFGSTILLSAFLVFQVQPIISKAILPWFGGTPAVWTTCMLFFQLLLFGGYCYAHWLSRYKVQHQAYIHLPLLIVAALLLPITPADTWKPTEGTAPAWHILKLLLANVGLPYFLLSSTGPLVQSWFRRVADGSSPYRLYALSNIGSLAALLTYPVAFEPWLAISKQGYFWSLGFGLFAIACAITLWHVGSNQTNRNSELQVDASRDKRELKTWSGHPWLAWLGLPALASVVLLATTNHVCQDVAVIPFLWVFPLSLYLLTFIICFDHERWYRRQWMGWATVSLITMVSLVMLFDWLPGLLLEACLYLGTMFCICMICHGELARLKPHPRHLTRFYLLISAGGALGGFLVAIVCPLLLNSFAEFNLALVISFGVALSLLIDRSRQPSGKFQIFVRFAFAASIMVVFAGQVATLATRSAHATRNFYGVLRLNEAASQDPLKKGRFLMHGRICHGFQFSHEDRNREPTLYYARKSGVGLTFENYPRTGPLRVGVVGLGAGTIAAYGRPGDLFRFYEINDEVVRIARQDFGFLEDSSAEVEVELGDARNTLERSEPANFDILVLDAFSGDAIPAHLMTAEAFQLYLRHLKPNGVIACNISNRHLEIERVLTPIARKHGLEALDILVSRDEEVYQSASEWFLMTRNQEFLNTQAMVTAGRAENEQYASLPIWTDQSNNLFRILK